MAADPEKEILRLTRRVKRVEETLAQVELIRDTNARLLERLMTELAAERARVRELLLNVLPARIVARLEAGETVIADRHPSVAVLFSDFVGFTEISSRIEPSELVAQLNELFTAFDASCVAHGVEKLGTIGDAYMAAAGLDNDPINPSVALTRVALDMLDAVRATDGAWRIRIGIHMGPVVAGVIGTGKYAYDVWGDTVNVASRLETTALVDHIQVSKPVADAIAKEFEVVPRGPTPLKGKGDTPTWFVLGLRRPTLT